MLAQLRERMGDLRGSHGIDELAARAGRAAEALSLARALLDAGAMRVFVGLGLGFVCGVLFGSVVLALAGSVVPALCAIAAPPLQIPTVIAAASASFARWVIRKSPRLRRPRTTQPIRSKFRDCESDGNLICLRRRLSPVIR